MGVATSGLLGCDLVLTASLLAYRHEFQNYHYSAWYLPGNLRAA